MSHSTYAHPCRENRANLYHLYVTETALNKPS